MMKIIKNVLLCSILIILSNSVYGKIYQCQSKDGKISFSDKVCVGNESVVHIKQDKKQNREVVKQKSPEIKEPAVSLDRSGEEIYNSDNEFDSDEKLGVKKIVIVQETSYSLLLDIFYYNFNKLPAGEIHLFITPDMSHWAFSPVKIHRGVDKVRASISLYDKTMDEAGISQVESSLLNVSFDHYLPNKYNGSIKKHQVPLVKLWQVRQKK